MKFKRIISVLLSVLMILGTFSVQTFSAEDNAVNTGVNADVNTECSFSYEQVIIKLANNEYTYGLDELTADSFGVNCSEIRNLNPSEDTITQSSGEYSVEDVSDTNNNVYVLTLEESGENVVEEALEILNDNPAIEIAEPDYLYEFDATPNDPSYSTQYALQKINATEAWNITRGSSNVVVGVIDTGIQGTHPDLIDNLWVNPNANQNGYINDIHGYDFVNRTGGTPTDNNGHGTHVSGIIGASGNNGLGISGVNWNVSLAWLGVGAGGNSISTSAVIEALNYANLNDILITNNSYGGGGYSEIFKEAISNYRGLFVASAGNNGRNADNIPHYPSSYDLPNIISVASTDSVDQLSSFSNYGVTSVDIAAPGSGVYSTVPTSTYANKSGTSMATPYVAGVAALLLSEYPGLSTSQIKAAILRGTDELTQLENKVATGGRLNAYKALQAAQTTIDVYFQNSSNWSLVKAYYWTDNGSAPVVWPGTTMTCVYGNIYKATIPSDCDNIIFSNNGETQTDNLSIPGNNQLYIPTSETWISYNPDDMITVYFQNDNNWLTPKAYFWESYGYFYPTSWPGESMTHVRANIYKISVPARCDKIIFSNNGNSQTDDINLAGDGKIYNSVTKAWSNYNPLDDTTITLYFTNVNNWSNVKAYLWNNVNTSNNIWPGESMKYVRHNEYNQAIYSITFDSSAYDRVIFNGSGGQTVNITVGSDGTGYYLTGTKTGTAWDVATYGYVVS